MTYILIMVSIIALGFAVTSFYISYTQRNYFRSLLGDSTDPVEILQRLKVHQLRQKDLKRLIDEVHADQQANKSMLERSFNRSGLVRFNPYRDTGGDQSFSLCLLNTNLDGFIITTIHGREGTRVYAKPIAQSRSTYDLSDEETAALNQALKS